MHTHSRSGPELVDDVSTGDLPAVRATDERWHQPAPRQRGPRRAAAPTAATPAQLAAEAAAQAEALALAEAEELAHARATRGDGGRLEDRPGRHADPASPADSADPASADRASAAEPAEQPGPAAAPATPAAPVSVTPTSPVSPAPAPPGAATAQPTARSVLLRERGTRSLRDAVLDPDPDGRPRRARREEGASPWRTARAWLAEHPGLGEQEWTRVWLDAVRRESTAPARTEHLLTALEVLSALLDDGAGGWRGRQELARFAAGHDRALDDGGPVADLVLRGLACAGRTPLPRDAPGRRVLWTRFGVLPDQVSVSCIAVGIAPAGDEGGRRWRLAALDGAPVHVTARDLQSHAEPWVCVDEAWPYVLVCEQPMVLQAVADAFNGRVPVICTGGTPEPLVVELLHRLRTSGAELRYHGDLDWPGVAAANLLLARCRAQPWRMGAGEYRAAVRSQLPALTGTPVTPAWDAELGALMTATGRALPQEQVLPELLAAVRDEVVAHG